MSLLRDIEAFLRRTGMAPSRFGRNVCNDPRLVYDMRMGREPGEKLAAAARDFMRNASAS